MNTDVIKFSEVITREEFKSGNLYFDTPQNLKEYFLWIKERFDSGEQYPYDLEELVGIAYAQKVKAVEALEKDFSQPIDYTIVSQTGKNQFGTGRPSKQYLLTPTTFESMVARRCQPVMEIYVKIFHAATSQPQNALQVRTPHELAMIQLECEMRVAELFKCPPHIIEQEIVKSVRKQTGIDFQHLLKHAKSQQNILPTEIMLEPTELGMELNSGSGRSTNLFLEDLGLQQKIGSFWEPTEFGRAYCQKHAWTQGNKTGYNLKWNLKMIESLIVSRRHIG